MIHKSFSPQLRTTNLEATLDFYINTLGMELDFRYEDFYAGIRAGNQQIQFKLVDDPDPSIAFVREGDHLHLYFRVSDVDSYAAELKAKDVSFRHELAEKPWGAREFAIEDNQGHILYFAQDEESAS